MSIYSSAAIDGLEVTSSSGFSSPGTDASDDSEEISRPQTARKSTATRDRTQSRVVYNRRRGLFNFQQQRSNQTQRPTEPQRPAPNTNSSNFIGPQGLGRGKGSIRRIQNLRQERLRRARNQLERKMKIFERMDCRVGQREFYRLVRATTTKLFPNSTLKFQSMSLRLIKNICECYLVNMFETANLFTIHAGRVTLFPKDIRLYCRVEKRFEELHPKRDQEDSQ